MQSIPLNAQATSLLDLHHLQRRLESVADKRKAKGLRYQLASVLLLVVLAKLAGQDRPSGIAAWVEHRGEQLRRALHLPWKRMPHHNTYRRLFQDVVPPDHLDRMVGQELQSLPGVGHSDLVAIDGKTVRGVICPERPRGAHLLAAYLPDEGIVLMQVAAGEKENEISVAPTLLAGLKLRGKVVVGDALHTQRQLSRQILAAGGDYVWVAKENQPTLRADIEHLFTASDRTVLGGHLTHDFRECRTVGKGHGRQERRVLTVSSELAGYSDWPGLRQVFRLERERQTTQTGKVEHEVVYGLTSLGADVASADRLLSLTRRYWGIENGLHHRRDVTFQEDGTRQTRGQAGHVMASLNNFVIGLLRQAGATNLAEARRWCEATITLMLAAPTP
jgi:predicted transposase YbfD/YdcC